MRKRDAICRSVACILMGLLASGPTMAAEGALVSELRLGVFDHDEGIFSSRKESGVDINGEVLFKNLGWFGPRVALRPHLGASINTNGNTSQYYFGLTATVPLWKKGFFEFSEGASVHTGHLHDDLIGHKDLGCRVLFRESLSLGTFFDEHNSVAVVADHISNANICDKNEGLETVGLRYGYRF